MSPSKHINKSYLQRLTENVHEIFGPLLLVKRMRLQWSGTRHKERFGGPGSKVQCDKPREPPAGLG